MKQADNGFDGRVSNVKPAEKRPRMLESVFTSTPFCKAIVAQEIPPRAGEMSRSDKRGPSAGEAMPQIVEADAGQSVAVRHAVEHMEQIRPVMSTTQRIRCTPFSEIHRTLHKLLPYGARQKGTPGLVFVCLDVKESCRSFLKSALPRRRRSAQRPTEDDSASRP